MKYTFYITPCAKPRMTRSDRWNQRPAVVKYWEFKDQLVREAGIQEFTLPDAYRVDFYIPMPASWSKKKREAMRGKYHQQKPDIDNLVKSLNDCLKDDDSSVYYVHAVKFWNDVERIEVEEVNI